MFDRDSGGDRVIILHPDIDGDRDSEDLVEFEELARSAGAEVLSVFTAPRKRADPAYLVGSGKVEEIATAVAETGAEALLVNHVLSPIQERNIERQVKCRVHDRTTLILDIFAQRAASHEGKLQVELAQLRHLATRLVRGWTHLERQKGGIGLRGPGETQLETDRRLLNERVKTLRKRLEKVDKQRAQTRRARGRDGTSQVALVGYTNAGKSTLFNRLTDENIYAADKLFATLDPTVRKIDGIAGLSVVIADTVGFIRHLPHELVAAFRATLDETRLADLLLHVIDASADDREDLIASVHTVLDEIGADDVPVLKVFNKIDLLDDFAPQIIRNDGGAPIAVWVSAVADQGMDLLEQAIGERLAGELEEVWIELGPDEGAERARLFRETDVLEEHTEKSGQIRIKVRRYQGSGVRQQESGVD